MTTAPERPVPMFERVLRAADEIAELLADIATLPDNVEIASERDIDGYRDLFGVNRHITDHTVRVYAFGSQASDGTIYDIAVHLADGEDSGPHLNSDQARGLAAALLEAAAEIDGWAAR